MSHGDVVRKHAEDLFGEELAELARADTRRRPAGWVLSPWAVRTYVMGGALPNGFQVSAKYIGDARRIEVAIATLATERALLLFGRPGTAKSRVSEHLSAAISGTSKLLVQGTAGLGEEALRYSWNYAQLLARGYCREALVPSPVFVGMERGQVVRVEELTRVPSDVQDSLITILSEKVLPIPELAGEVQAQRGFNVVASANDLDRGVNEMSSALKRRFNVVSLPLPDTVEAEVEIVAKRVAEMGVELDLPAAPPVHEEIRRVVTIFRDLREGRAEGLGVKVKSPSATLSTAEAISVIGDGMSLAGHFGDGTVRARDLASGMHGAIVRDLVNDTKVWTEYLDTVVRRRAESLGGDEGREWGRMYDAFREMV